MMTTQTKQPKEHQQQKIKRPSLSLAAANESKTNIEAITNILGFINEEFKCVHNNFQGILYVGPLALVFLGRIFFFEWTVVIKWEDVVHVTKQDDGVSVEVRAPKPQTYVFYQIFNPEKVWSTLVSLHNDSIIDTPKGSVRVGLRQPTPRQVSQTFRRRNSDPVSSVFDFTEPPAHYTGDIFSPNMATMMKNQQQGGKYSKYSQNNNNNNNKQTNRNKKSTPARSGSAPNSPDFVPIPSSSSTSSSLSSSNNNNNLLSSNSNLSGLLMSKAINNVDSYSDEDSPSKTTVVTQQRQKEMLERQWSEILEDMSAYKEIAVEKQEINCDLKSFLDRFVQDDASYSIKEFMTVNGDEEIDITKWKKTVFKSVGSTRTIEYTHPVNAPMAPPKARARKEQTFKRYGNLGLIIKTKTFVSDVPMTDCFYVEDVVRVEAIGGDNDDDDKKNKVSISIRFGLTFVKSTMFRSIIERTTNGEFQEFGKNYADFLVKSIEGGDIATAASTKASAAAASQRHGLSTETQPLQITTPGSGGYFTILLCMIVFIFQVWMFLEMRAMHQDFQKLFDIVVTTSQQQQQYCTPTQS